MLPFTAGLGLSEGDPHEDGNCTCIPCSRISGTFSWRNSSSSSNDIVQLTGDGSLRLLAIAGTEEDICPSS